MYGSTENENEKGPQPLTIRVLRLEHFRQTILFLFAHFFKMMAEMFQS